MNSIETELDNINTTYYPHTSDTGICLDVKDFDLWYGEKQALFKNTFTIENGFVTSLIGPSGCGKSTLLRCFNRMNDLIDGIRIAGKIKLGDKDIFDPHLDVISLRKRMGMVFQKPNPFPMSIADNVSYPLKVDGVSDKKIIEQTVETSLRGAALWEEVKDRLKDSALALSGGQQQRLCIARAIASDPEVLLMDEPCSALDPVATAKIEELINELKGSYTIVIVTHSMQQAGRISDNTAFMLLGRLIEYGNTKEMFSSPVNAKTHDYINGRFG